MALSGQVQQKTGNVHKAAVLHRLQRGGTANLRSIQAIAGDTEAQQMTDCSKALHGKETVSKRIKRNTLLGRHFQRCNTHTLFGYLPVLPKQDGPNRLTHRQTLL